MVDFTAPHWQKHWKGLWVRYGEDMAEEHTYYIATERRVIGPKKDDPSVVALLYAFYMKHANMQSSRPHFSDGASIWLADGLTLVRVSVDGKIIIIPSELFFKYLV